MFVDSENDEAAGTQVTVDQQEECNSLGGPRDLEHIVRLSTVLNIFIFFLKKKMKVHDQVEPPKITLDILKLAQSMYHTMSRHKAIFLEVHNKLNYN